MLLQLKMPGSDVTTVDHRGFPTAKTLLHVRLTMPPRRSSVRAGTDVSMVVRYFSADAASAATSTVLLLLRVESHIWILCCNNRVGYDDEAAPVELSFSLQSTNAQLTPNVYTYPAARVPCDTIRVFIVGA